MDLGLGGIRVAGPFIGGMTATILEVKHIVPITSCNGESGVL